MGLLKAGAGALGGVLADQWRDYFYCEALDADTLVAKGEKRVGKRSSNKKGDENIISNGSVIAVNDGQCMMIVEQGKIVEICAEPGEFVYDNSSEPSIFYGSLGENIKNTFAQIGKRFTFGGDTGKDQRVYYFNTKEITGNRFGTATPIPFRVVDRYAGYALSVDLRCNGVYSYKLVNPLLFYTNVCGNVEESYDRSEIDEMLKGELMNALQPALAKISVLQITYSEIPAHTKEVSEALKEELAAEWRDRRGLEIFSMNFNSVSIPEDQRKKITEWEEIGMTSSNPNAAAARLVGAQSDAMRTAAANQGGMGAMGGFFGMGMAQNAGGANAAELFNMGRQGQQQQPQQPAAQGWTCSCGATGNTGKFCMECGKPQPSAEGWTCSCGAVNQGKFCTECGKPKPAGAPLYRCDKCGWQPEDPTHPPKFCPECGDVFDDNDIQS